LNLIRKKYNQQKKRDLKNLDPQTFEKSQSPKTKLRTIEPIALRHAALFAVTTGDKAAKLMPILSSLPMHSDTDAQPKLLHFSGAPNEATTFMAESHDGEERSEREH
jgi:hypothetical protein